MTRIESNQGGATGWILLWLLGLPIPVLLGFVVTWVYVS